MAESVAAKSTGACDDRQSKRNSRLKRWSAVLLVSAAILAAGFFLFEGFEQGQAAAFYSKEAENRRLLLDPQTGNSEKEKTTYHLLPHSHMDLGWLSTEDVYLVTVSRIINGMLDHLEKNPAAKFNFADIGFLAMHTSQYPESIPRLKALVAEGRVDIINGGYVLLDHASVSYDDMISNYQFGRKYVREKFGSTPKTIWAIDQFGLSAAATKLAVDLGYTAQVINRVPDSVKREMRQTKDLLFKWKPDPFSDSIDTLVLPKHYNSESPMDYDHGVWGYYPGQPYSNILDSSFNLDSQVPKFMDNVKGLNGWFKNREVSCLMGDDFTYIDFSRTYASIDAVFIFVNSNLKTGRFGDAEVKVSTADEYFAAVRNSPIQYDYKVKEEGDFFPLVQYDYEITNKVAWSGYFTTNPHSKLALREFGLLYRGLRSILANHLLENPDKLGSIVETSNHSEWVLGANLHHDTITGTSKMAVAKHYLERQQAELDKTAPVWQALVSHLINGKPEESKPDGEAIQDPLNFFDFLAEWTKPNAISTDFFSTFYPSPKEPSKKIDASTDFKIEFVNPAMGRFDFEAFKQYLIMNQAQPGVKILRFTSKTPIDRLIVKRVNDQKEEVATSLKFVAEAKDQQPSSLWEYSVPVKLACLEYALLQPAESSSKDPPQSSIFAEMTTLTAGDYSLRYEGGSLFIQGPVDLSVAVFMYTFDEQVRNQAGLVTSDIPEINNLDYKEKWMHSPGKYIFSTTDKEPSLLKPSSAKYRFLKENSRVVISLTYDDYGCSAQLEVDPDLPSSEVLTVRLFCEGSRKNRNFDLVVRYSTQLKSDRTFFTDANGLYAMEREREEHGKYVESNYYPITRFAYVQDANQRFTVMVDRGEGATSPKEGVLEVMFYRESKQDDHRGADEDNFEGLPATIFHKLLFENSKQDDQIFRQAQISMDLPPIVVKLITNSDNFSFSLHSNTINAFDPPKYLKVVLDTKSDGSIYARLASMNQQGDLTFDLESLFSGLFTSATLKSYRECTLDFNDIDGNQENLSFKAEVIEKESQKFVTLKPLEIKAFKLVF